MFAQELFPSFKTGAAAAERAPEPARAEPKVEVTFEQTEDGETVALKYLTWTEGLGWCCQKTIRVEAEQLDELQRALTAARHRIRRRRAEAGEAQAPAQVIQFPSLS
ncbi:MAG TPA: hypothetical protein VJ866_04715 [Pyrinomonadaceae bacterium]|nr:hypothetical protein [Pyrinomonadaceae bacterium]